MKPAHRTARRRAFASLLATPSLALAGCSATATVAAPSSWAPPAASTTGDSPGAASVPPPAPLSAHPDVELRDAHVALVHGQAVAFDGVAEGLSWPALARALGPRKAGDVVTLDVGRSVPIGDLLRAAWTVHAADVRVQSADATGTMRAVELRAKHDGAPVGGCHLAVFVRPDGSLRVAAPGGPREVTGEHAAQSLARSLEAERSKCPLKYVAFGAESDAAAWGTVFDVLLAVDQDRSAGDARYVLGQALRPGPR